MVNYIRDNRGFTLVEIIMYIVIAGLGMGVTYGAFSSQVDSYSNIAQRKMAMSDTRYAINRITYELMRVENSNISSITSHRVSFTDSSDSSTSFQLSGSGDSQSLDRGTEKLLDHVKTFDVVYYDEDGNVLDAIDDNISQIRKFEITVTTLAQGDEGELSLSATITPREFIYDNYQ